MLFNTCLSVGNIGILKSPTFIMLGLIYIFIYNNVFNKIGDTQKINTLSYIQKFQCKNPGSKI